MNTKTSEIDVLKAKDFAFSFPTSRSAEEVYKTLLDVRNWWMGVYGESIEGSSGILNDEFIFKAGNGAHYSRQQLTEAVPNKKLVWLVTDSHLSFAQKPDEWTGTKIRFDISGQPGKTTVHFTHEGLVPEFECYSACSGGWTQYLENLKKRLK